VDKYFPGYSERFRPNTGMGIMTLWRLLVGYPKEAKKACIAEIEQIAAE